MNNLVFPALPGAVAVFIGHDGVEVYVRRVAIIGWEVRAEHTGADHDRYYRVATPILMTDGCEDDTMLIDLGNGRYDEPGIAIHENGIGPVLDKVKNDLARARQAGRGCE